MSVYEIQNLRNRGGHEVASGVRPGGQELCRIIRRMPASARRTTMSGDYIHRWAQQNPENAGTTTIVYRTAPVPLTKEQRWEEHKARLDRLEEQRLQVVRSNQFWDHRHGMGNGPEADNKRRRTRLWQQTRRAGMRPS